MPSDEWASAYDNPGDDPGLLTERIKIHESTTQDRNLVSQSSGYNPSLENMLPFAPFLGVQASVENLLLSIHTNLCCGVLIEKQQLDHI
jgi:hypothetical protein